MVDSDSLCHGNTNTSTKVSGTIILCYHHDLWVCKSNLEDYDTDKLEFISGISCFPSKGFQNFHWRNPDVAWCRKEFCAAVNRFKFEKTTWHWKGVKMMYSRTQCSVRCQATKKQRIEWYWKNVLLFLDHFEWVHQNLREQTCCEFLPSQGLCGWHWQVEGAFFLMQRHRLKWQRRLPAKNYLYGARVLKN